MNLNWYDYSNIIVSANLFGLSGTYVILIKKLQWSKAYKINAQKLKVLKLENDN